MFFKICVLFCFISAALSGELVDTFYGPIDVEETVLLELINSPAMQRLKHIHQYGVAYYTTHPEEYNRFDHSLGVFALLRRNGATLEEQITGLIHDISHTVFSHVGDWIFGMEYREVDYQTTIFKLYLSHSGIEQILLKYGFTIHQVCPLKQGFELLEQPLPNLCADRIDYNIQGAFHQHFISKQEAIELFEDFKFVEGRWITSRIDLLKKIAKYSYFMTQDCWGNPFNYLTSKCLADAILRGLDIGQISWHEIHFGLDHDVWNKLMHSNDTYITKRMRDLGEVSLRYRLVNPTETDFNIKFRNRGIDPLVWHDGELRRLSAVDSEIAQEYAELSEKAKQGWYIKEQ
jgi:uncharacterized protein